MGFPNSKESEPLRELARSFAARELAKNVRRYDRHPYEPFPTSLVERAHDAGLLGIVLPADAGGAGVGIDAVCAILEEVSRTDASFAALLLTHASAQMTALAIPGGPQAPGVAEGVLCTRGDVLAFPVYMHPLRSRDTLPKALAAASGCTVTGRLEMVSLGGIAGRAVVPAMSLDGVSFFLIDLAQERIRRSETVITLGMHACPCVDLDLDAAAAEPMTHVAPGEPEVERLYAKLSLGSAALASGIMEGAYETALSYAQERFQGGRRIIDWSEVAMILADMLVKVRAAQLCVAACCRLFEEAPGDAASLEHAHATAAHVHAMAADVVENGIQVLGGYGYMKDFGQEKRYRDAHQAASLFGNGPLARLALLDGLTPKD